MRPIWKKKEKIWSQMETYFKILREKKRLERFIEKLKNISEKFMELRRKKLKYFTWKVKENSEWIRKLRGNIKDILMKEIWKNFRGNLKKVSASCTFEGNLFEGNVEHMRSILR